MKKSNKFTPAQLDTLAAEYAGTPDRLSDENIAKLRAIVEKLSDAALGQVFVHKIKWLRSLAMTEARKRGYTYEQLAKLAE